MLLKSPSVQIRLNKVDVKYRVRMEGHVTYLNFCQPLAPSTLAASYCSLGIARRPAIRIRVQNGSAFQMCTSIAIESPSTGSLSQFGTSAPLRRKMSEFTTPHSRLSVQRI